ncbi:MAG: signal peptide peptidase SppA [Planctomycetota bacterium]|nr:MAG: signal peptide peptidase SppA [Planctomycetota bacterium]
MKTRSALVAAGMLGSLMLSGCMPDGLLITLVNTERELEERELYRDGRWTADKIAVIDVDGIILNAPAPKLFSAGEHPVSLLTEQLDKARRDRAVKAVVLRINSPGGAVTASDLMHDEIRRFRASGKPVVAHMMDVAASGGYYIACACDEIAACRTTVTGSIGVIMQLFDVEGTMKLIGVTSNTITSGPHKDSGSPFRTMRDEERALFQAMVDDMYARFVEVVDEGRANLDAAQVRTLADGRVYTAPQALKAGLIDRIGTLRDTIEAVKKRVGIDAARVVVYHRPLDYRPTIYAQPPSAPEISVLRIDGGALPTPTPQFLYLWAPGL